MTNFESSRTSGWTVIKELSVGMCDHCSNITIWLNEDLIYPNRIGVIQANEDMNADIQADYNEAAEVIGRSPRAAAALLRLCIQKLCKQLGESGKDIDKDIGCLVKKGLSPQIQRSLDIVRVIGNESVHPGQINLNDNKETAYKLFELVNLIAQTMITQPKEIDAMYKTLPKKKLEGIKKRDGK